MNRKQTPQDWFESELAQIKDSPEFILETLLVDITAQIAMEMEQQGISKSDLARKMGKKPSFITRLLKGETNLTFKTAVEVGFALGLNLTVTFQGKCNETAKQFPMKKSA